MGFTRPRAVYIVLVPFTRAPVWRFTRTAVAGNSSPMRVGERSQVVRSASPPRTEYVEQPIDPCPMTSLNSATAAMAERRGGGDRGRVR